MAQLARILFGATALADIMVHDDAFCREAARIVREGYTIKQAARILRRMGW